MALLNVKHSDNENICETSGNDSVNQILLVEGGWIQVINQHFSVFNLSYSSN